MPGAQALFEEYADGPARPPTQVLQEVGSVELGQGAMNPDTRQPPCCRSRPARILASHRVFGTVAPEGTPAECTSCGTRPPVRTLQPLHYDALMGGELNEAETAMAEKVFSFKNQDFVVKDSAAVEKTKKRKMQ